MTRSTVPVVLDLGNVLIAVEFQRFVHRVAALTGRAPTGIAERWVTGPAKRRYERGELTGREFFGAMAADLGWPAERRNDLLCAWTDIFSPVPGAAATVADLAARGPVWLLSDTNPVHLRACRRRWPWLDRCCRSFVSWRTGRLKAEPGGFAAVLAAAPCPPGQLVFLDDLPANVAAARAAGLDARLFRGWDTGRAELGLPPGRPEAPAAG